MSLLPPPPAIPSFAAGYGYTPTFMDALVQAPLTFLCSQIVFRAHDTSNQALSTSFSNLTYDTVDEDPYSGWNASSHQWLAPYTGWYSVTVTCSVATAGVSLRVAVGQSGAAQYEGTGALLAGAVLGEGSAAAVVLLAGGTDFITGQALASGACSTDTSSPGRFPSLEITYYAQP